MLLSQLIEECGESQQPAPRATGPRDAARRGAAPAPSSAHSRSPSLPASHVQAEARRQLLHGEASLREQREAQQRWAAEAQRLLAQR